MLTRGERRNLSRSAWDHAVRQGAAAGEAVRFVIVYGRLLDRGLPVSVRDAWLAYVALQAQPGYGSGYR
jgi:hypothetical protein